MSVVYEVNEFDEVVGRDCGRLNNDTSSYRAQTDFEVQLLEQVVELEAEIEKLNDAKANPLDALLGKALPSADVLLAKYELILTEINNLMCKKWQEIKDGKYDNGTIKIMNQLEAWARISIKQSK